MSSFSQHSALSQAEEQFGSPSKNRLMFVKCLKVESREFQEVADVTFCEIEFLRKSIIACTVLFKKVHESLKKITGPVSSRQDMRGLMYSVKSMASARKTLYIVL